MAKSTKGKKHLTVRFADEVINKIEMLAASKEKTLSFIIREAVEMYIKEEEAQGNIPEHKEIKYQSAEERKRHKKSQ